MNGDQLAAIGLLGAVVALGLGLFFLLVLLARRIWIWVVGGRARTGQEQRAAPKPEPASETAPAKAYSPVITASDLFAIRSNLDAVSRQIEDLERKLRLSSHHPANVVDLKRK